MDRVEVADDAICLKIAVAETGISAPAQTGKAGAKTVRVIRPAAGIARFRPADGLAAKQDCLTASSPPRFSGTP